MLYLPPPRETWKGPGKCAQGRVEAQNPSSTLDVNYVFRCSATLYLVRTTAVLEVVYYAPS